MHFHADSCQHFFPIVRSELPFVNAISFITRRARYAIGKNQKILNSAKSPVNSCYYPNELRLGPRPSVPDIEFIFNGKWNMLVFKNRLEP